MYFTRDAQAKVLARFHFALKPDGFLFMGRAELLLTHGALFTPAEPKWRVFTKTAEQHAREQLGLTHPEQGSVAMANDDRIHALTIETDPVARVVVRADGTVALVSARALFRLGPQDVGKRLQDLELSYRPVELRSIIQEAMTSHRAVSRRDVPFLSDSGETVFLELEVAPLIENLGGGGGDAADLHGHDPVAPPSGGTGAFTDRERALRAGFDSWLVKPIDPSVLLGVIAKGREPASAHAASSPPPG